MSSSEGSYCSMSYVSTGAAWCLSYCVAHLSPLGVMASKMTCMRALCCSIACTAATAPAATIAPVSVGLFVFCMPEALAQVLHTHP